MKNREINQWAQYRITYFFCCNVFQTNGRIAINMVKNVFYCLCRSIVPVVNTFSIILLQKAPSVEKNAIYIILLDIFFSC